MQNLIQTNISLKNKNWFETGGNAEYFSEPKTKDDIIKIFNFANEKNLKITFLGAGANILINDNGIEDLVIKSNFNEIFIENKKDFFLVTAGSGVEIDFLISYCLDSNAIGLEEFSGIPGTVGGAVYINIHYFKFLISQFITKAEIYDIEKNEIIEVENNWFEFGYDYSKLFSKKYFLINATFKLNKGAIQETFFAKGRSFEIIRHRKQRYPYKGTCGCFFRNFHENEIIEEINGKKILAAAYYLESVGVKGNLKYGDAGVSHQHSNMIVNFGNAKSSDIIEIAKIMQQKVYDKFNLKLIPECELLGFHKNILL
jgi:UDP-N-acetylmuramate dehydrogenase